ncbi:hypothetical protein [Thiocapsa sp.]|uniref:hypothetical protein n=1 Tax=Thiocapsa sp. TaxID=2024551 RepID=UPI003593D37E
MLIEGEERLGESGAALWVAALNPAVLRMMRISPLGKTLGRERMLFNLQIAVERYVSQTAQPEEIQ